MRSTPTNPDTPVTFITGDGNYTRVHYADGKRVILPSTLAKVLLMYPYLVRVSKHAAINCEFVDSWHRRLKVMCIQLNLQDRQVTIEASRRRATKVEQELLQRTSMRQVEHRTA